jgi:hypothetical protein
MLLTKTLWSTNKYLNTFKFYKKKSAGLKTKPTEIIKLPIETNKVITQ